MKNVMRMLASLAIWHAPSVLSIIRDTSWEDKKKMKGVMLDQKEVKKRGSHCLDGSAPEYSIKLGKYGDKWAFDIKSPSGVCMDKKECLGKLPVLKYNDTEIPTVLQSFNENGYNLVLVQPCDFGMLLGDREHPAHYKGKKLYYQGARIIRHIISDIGKKYNLGGEVILLGGSGGAQSLYAGANYFQSLMPKTVHKFGLAPINGWYTPHGNDNEFKHIFQQMNMKGQVNRKCVREMGEHKAHLCLNPAYTYNSIKAPAFITQAFDGTFKAHADPMVTRCWDQCLEPSLTKKDFNCTQARIDVLQKHITNFTSAIKSYSKAKGAKEGGYFTTCAEHVFYKSDHYSKYQNKGISAEKAIWRWWTQLESPEPRWYWPSCELTSPDTPQCESSCRGK